MILFNNLENIRKKKIFHKIKTLVTVKIDKYPVP